MGNSGNVLTERPSTQVLAAPGGESSMVNILGGNSNAIEHVGVTSNKFASGANPNSGNVLTERSSTRVHAAPGGESSLGSLLGGSTVADVDVSKRTTTSNSFACNAKPNSGNVLTGRSSTRIHCAPGGKSSLTLGTDGYDALGERPAVVEDLSKEQLDRPGKPKTEKTSNPKTGKRIVLGEISNIINSSQVDALQDKVERTRNHV